MTREVLVWSGNCRDCAAMVYIAAHDETPDDIRERINEGDWESFPSCYACDGSIDWNGSDPLPLTIRA